MIYSLSTFGTRDKRRIDESVQTPLALLATSDQGVLRTRGKVEGFLLSGKFIKPTPRAELRRLAKSELQAMFNAYRVEGKQRVRVTDKAMTELLRQLRGAPGIDVQEFIAWVMENWGRVAERHERFYRSINKFSRKRAIPKNPNFGALSYRCRYFISCFNKRLTERETAQEERVRYAREDRQKQEVRLKFEDAILRRVRQRKIASCLAVPKRDVQVVHAIKQLDMSDIPTWEEHKQREELERSVARKGHRVARRKPQNGLLP